MTIRNVFHSIAYGVLSELLCLSALAQVAPTTMPRTIVETLNQEFPGWHFPKHGDIISDPDVRAGRVHPYFVKGDWNGDGSADYGALIYQDSNRRQTCVAFLGKRKGFSMKVVRVFNGITLSEFGTYDCECYLRGAKKGSSVRTAAGRDLRLKNDTMVNEPTAAGAGEAYVFEKGSFRVIALQFSC